MLSKDTGKPDSQNENKTAQVNEMSELNEFTVLESFLKSPAFQNAKMASKDKSEIHCSIDRLMKEVKTLRKTNQDLESRLSTIIRLEQAQR